eukprot:3849402-Pyramimonas_sp.AAC.1
MPGGSRYLSKQVLLTVLFLCFVKSDGNLSVDHAGSSWFWCQPFAKMILLPAANPATLAEQRSRKEVEFATGSWRFDLAR